MIKVGDKAPEFRLKADDGKEVSLSDFRGKRVLLFFFPKANTSG
jgi:peroxiredoxin Q/BCP